MNKYKCIKGFCLEKCDDNGFTLENEYMEVEENSMWETPEEENYRFIGGEIRLELCDKDSIIWIEIPKENLQECFDIIKES